MDIDFGPDGTISGYKTEFMKTLAPELKDDLNQVVVENPTKKSSIAACYDVDGHMCYVCLNSQHYFVEIKAPLVLSTKICFDCVNKMNELTQQITMRE